jgi:hypothetical protein
MIYGAACVRVSVFGLPAAAGVMVFIVVPKNISGGLFNLKAL